MVKEPNSDNKSERDAIAKAIASLKSRGCDVNAYSVADEAEIPRGTLARNADLLRLVSEARGDGKNGSSASGSASGAAPGSELEELERELKQLQWENGVLRRYFQDAQAENKKLQEEMGRVQEEAANIAKSINVAYQQGYFAGQLASGMTITVEPKAVPDKAVSDTTSGASAAAPVAATQSQTVAAPQPVAESQPAAAPQPMAEPQPVAEPQPIAKPHFEPEPVSAEAAASTVSGASEAAVAADKKNEHSITQEIPPVVIAGGAAASPYVADVPLHIADPEVLNDPFTAKLLNALQAEGTLADQSYDYDELNAETEAIHALTPEDLLAPLPENLIIQETAAAVAPEPVSAPQPVVQPAPQPEPQPEPQPVAAGAPTKRVKSPQELAQTLERIPKPDVSKPAAAAQAVAEPVTAHAVSEPVIAHAEADPVITHTVTDSMTVHSFAGPDPDERLIEEPEIGYDSQGRITAVDRATHGVAPEAPGAADEYDEEDEIAKVIAAKGGSIASKYTADELHNLFRNRYVKGEEAAPEQPVASQPAAKNLENSQPTKKFVGTNKSTQAEGLPTAPRAFPPEIRKACRLVGLNPEDLTRAIVIEAWKREMSKPGVHPDTGGDTEMAIYLNTAKDTLIRWVEDQTPKLGKKFGQKGEKQPKPKSE